MRHGNKGCEICLPVTLGSSTCGLSVRQILRLVECLLLGVICKHIHVGVREKT